MNAPTWSSPNAPITVPEDTLNTPTPKILLTVEEAAAYLGVGRTTMYALVSSGDVESVLVGRLRRVPPDAVDAYVMRLRTMGRAA